MVLVLVVSASLLAYSYVGYLLLLRLVVAARGPKPVRKAEIQPPLTLVISAFNEAAVIGKKLENAVSLEYPRDRYEIAVISDASDDGTDEIVRQFADRGVRLFRQEVRRGKTAGLNAVVPQLAGELVVFSDANAIYKSDALLMLARNFADPEVGCVTGEARYVAGDGAAADAGERVYWSYEMNLKRLETDLGSMVGGDGAIYAIRRTLWRELPVNAINDFLNPLQIVASGWRGVYEPEAVCYEETAGATALEYRRRVRIVSRSWRAVFQAGDVLNPFKVGLFAWSLTSHKILRWMSGPVALLAGMAGAFLLVDALQAWPGLTMAVLGVTAAVAVLTPPGRRTLAMLGYFGVVTAASGVGLVKGSVGQVSGVWTTPRSDAAPARVTAPTPRAARAATVPVGVLFLLALAAVVVATVAALPFGRLQSDAAIVFWGSMAVLAYVYLGYPALLGLLKRVLVRTRRVAPIEPSVCVFIAANDEGSVIAAKIRNTLALDYPPDRLEIVVASDGSVDDTNAIVRAFGPRVRLLAFTPRRGKTAVIGDGMRQVTSDIVVLSDANAFLEPDAVRALVRNFADPDVGAVSGDVRLEGERAAFGYSEDLYYRYERWIQGAESAVGSMIGVDGALYAIRRELFVAPPADTILDDMAIPMAVIRAGRRVVFEPDARAHEQGSETAREEFARKTRVAAGAVQFLMRPDSSVPATALQVIFSLLSHKGLRWLSPAFGLCMLVASLALTSVSPWYGLAAATAGGVGAVGVAGCHPALRRVSVVSLAHYFCLVQAAAIVGLMRGLRRSQPVQWRRFRRVPVELA